MDKQLQIFFPMFLTSAIRSEIGVTNIRSLGFWDTRECVTLWRLILGCTRTKKIRCCLCCHDYANWDLQHICGVNFLMGGFCWAGELIHDGQYSLSPPFLREKKKVQFLVGTWVHYVRHSWQSCGHKSVVCPQHGGYTVRTYKKLKIHRISRFVVATFTTEKGISEIGFVFLGIRHFAWLLVDPIFGSHGDLEDTTYLS